MTRPPASHLSVDDIDAWLAGQLGAAGLAHLESCDECRGIAHTDRILLQQLSALTSFAPRADFADRVMAAVAVPDPFAIRSLETVRRRMLASRRSITAAAVLALVVVGAMAASIIWSVAHPTALAAAGLWLRTTAGEWLWTGLRSAVSSVMEQPGYTGLRGWIGSPTRLALLSGVASLAYVSGVLALRKLMTLPTGPVSHAGA